MSDRVALTLLDFNEKTIAQLQGKLQQIKHNHRPGAEFHLIKKSVQQVLKDSVRAVRMGGVPAYDFVYCAGLFDYLTDEVCKRLMDVFYDMLAPGGAGVDLISSFSVGSGGGGGGGGRDQSAANGNAGNYGGGGGGRGANSGTAGSGAGGICIITYTP